MGLFSRPQQQDTGIATARALADIIAGGGAPLPTAPTITLQRGEVQYGHLGFDAAQWCATDATYTSTLMLGRGILGLAGGLAVSAAATGISKQRAKSRAAAQWRPIGHVAVVVTNQRLVLNIGGRWSSVSYRELMEVVPDVPSGSLVLTFEGNDPMQLRGPAALWLTVAICAVLHDAPWMPGVDYRQALPAAALTAG